jgi:hypothetical protein
VLGVLAYHVEDEIARVELVGHIVLAAALVLLAGVLLRRVRWAPLDGRNRPARVAAGVVAIGLVTYALLRFPAFDDPSGTAFNVAGVLIICMWLSGLLGLALAPIGLSQIRIHGERRLAVLAFVGSLVLPGVLVVAAIACFATDGCFH